MAGRHQHHIPRFLQRAFGVECSGRPKEIWTFRRGEFAEKGLIKETAVDVDFYSSPSLDGTPTLDDKITKAESPLARLVRAVRDRAIGSSVTGDEAAEIITRLAPRTSHIRHAMIEGVRQLTVNAGELFTDSQAVEQLMGLDKDELTDVFLRQFRDAIKDHPELGAITIPVRVLERMALCVAKESLQSILADGVGQIGGLLRALGERLPAMARAGHNRALAEDDEVNVRRDLLKRLSWSIEAAPGVGALLPDCIAVASEGGEDWLPLMFLGTHIEVAVMPLAKDKLLVGKRRPVPVEVPPINEVMAACSHDFFLAATNAVALQELSALIGERSKRYLADATRSAIASSIPAPENLDPEICHRPPEANREIRYELSFLGVADAETTQHISDVTAGVVAAFTRTYSMARLDGITFATDYPSALRAVERGVEGAAPAETIGPEIGTGIAKRVVVIRGGRAMARCMMDGCVGLHLISDDPKKSDWALNVLSSQLGLVALMDLVEQALPGTLLHPPGTPYELFLYTEVDAAAHAYISAHISGGFGDPDEISDTYRELLVNSLQRLKAETERERLAYRTHGDLDRLLSVAMPAIGFVLHFAAQLLGHAEANGRRALDDAGKLEEALDRVGLANWLSDFHRHLEHFRQRIGRWKSFNEFLAFNRHVERLMWSVGMIPWDTPDGPYIQVPISTDTMALMKEIAESKVTLPNE